MTTLRLPLALRSSRRRVIVVLTTLVFLVGYILLVNHEEHAMEAYYADLKENNVELYLDKILQAQGFRTYLEEYLEAHDYTRPTSVAPPFLVGRWEMFDESMRVDDEFVPDSCSNALQIEDGRIKTLGVSPSQEAVHYTMVEDRVTAHREGLSPLTITVIGYGSHLHHIEVTDPALGSTHYGYMCR
ncbi:MAG: hypothetical protein K9H25_15930 [Rhodospirillum sp.]|nr:hypothetical protein [Rhodospirillum sp.]MCF8490910.1 hypothetical protein [Rhodospirillum sp.]MCF8499087.1 hypothetical protein [Rhodospirillum sp.]